MNRGEILQKLASGELNVEQATRLLQGEALKDAPPAVTAAAEPDGGGDIDDVASVDSIHDGAATHVAAATAAASATGNAEHTPHAEAQPHQTTTAEAEPETADADLPTNRPDPAHNGKRKHKGGLRWLHIEVTDSSRRRDRVRVNVPVGLVRAGVWMGSKFAKNMPPTLWESILDAIDNDEIGTLVEVDDFENGEHVRIYID